MTPEDLEPLRSLKGLVATIVLTGSVLEEFAMCRENLRAWNIEHGFRNVEYRNIAAQLVEHGRDEACRHALTEGYDFVLQIDADATFPDDSLARILHTAYAQVSDSDVVGGYAQLKHPPYLPTIDTGSGMWEPHYPGEGVKPVIRTGGHFLLIKTPILRRFGPPWFKTRRGMRPVDALREVDNFSRIHHQGRNILAGEEWDVLLAEAKSQGGGVESPVGEDSGFADAVLAAGGRMYVDTNLVIGHIGKHHITPDMLRDEMRKRQALTDGSVGVFT